MAERRMFAKTIIDSDAFMDMPMSARLLYYDLGMRADDDGFINSPKKIMRMIGATNDDINILIAKKFIIPFENGVIVIKAWKINNYIRSDRYKETNYKEEKRLLNIEETGMYTLKNIDKNYNGIPVGIPTGYTGKDRIGKDRIDNNIGEKSKRFIPPTLEEVKNYCLERNNNIDAENFINFYSSKGWYVGKNKMKDWKAAVRTWENRDKKTPPTQKAKLNDNQIYSKEHGHQNGQNPDFLKLLEEESREKSRKPFIDNIPGADQGGSG